MADSDQERRFAAERRKGFGSRFGEADGDMKKVAERHAAAIARGGPCPRGPAVSARPWIERLGRHFLLERKRDA